MNQWLKKLTIGATLLCAIIGIHDIYYWCQKKINFKKTLQKRAHMIAAHPQLLVFKSLEKETVLSDLPIQGTIPHWLEGTLVRNSVAKFETHKSLIFHPFDGFAMLHAFTIKDGKVSYANKFLKSNYYKKAMETGLIAKGFSSDPCPLIFAKFLSYFDSRSAMPSYDNNNVNVTKIAEKFIALTETPLPIEFDLKTVKTLDPFIFDDTLKGQVTTAHPHHDTETQESFNYLTHLGKESFYNVYSIPFKSKQRKLLASIPVKKPAYMHSFSLTKNYIILTEIPFRVTPLHLLITRKPFIKNFVWNSEEGTRFTIIRRKDGEIVGRLTGEPFFTFHHVNAFEEDNNVHVDLVAYDTAQVIDNLDFKNVFDEEKSTMLNHALPQRFLKRFTLNLDKASVVSKRLSNTLIEMPRIHYECYNMKPYHYVYAIDFSSKKTGLIKINVTNGETLTWHEENCSPAEPVFVAAPNGQDEDDGVILSVVLDESAQFSFLLVLNAKTFKEMGRAKVPHHIPFQIHGDFFRT